MDVMQLFVAVLMGYLANAKEDQPQFLGNETNVTVVVGRDATLTCIVANLHSYKVAWLRVDTQTILTIGSHVITKNHRIAVARADQTWSLTLRAAQLSDGGRYMCQINTEPMITQTHHLHVFVPPDIVDSASSGEVIVREGDNVTLHCVAAGSPRPTVAWRREDLAPMLVEGNSVSKWSGAWLNMSAVSRAMNGAYFCIATNGVPPSVSKRILLHVLCTPSVRVTQKQIGGYLGDAVVLRCKIEANPLRSVYWTHSNGNILNGSRYQESIKSESYKHTVSLQINKVSRGDVGTYQCHAENPLGSAHDDLNFYTLATTSSPTTTEVTTETEATTDVGSQLSSTEAEVTELKADENFPEEDNFVVVLSQHQMQNLDISPSS